MEIAINSVDSSSTSSTCIMSTSLRGAVSLLGEQNIKNNSESSPPSGFKNESASASSKDYALLASISLKNALNVNSDKTGSNGYRLLKNPDHHQCNSKILTSQNQSKLNIYRLAAGSLSSDNATTIQTTENSNKTNTSSSNAITSLICSSTNTTSLEMAVATTTTTTTPNSINTTLTPGTNGVTNGKIKLKIPSDVLDDLASRFIINAPDMELSNLIRICFQIELAHWFYLDFFCVSANQLKPDENGNKKKKLPNCGMKQFAIQIFQHIPFLREHLSTIDKIFDDWKNYKLSVPTYGAILISEDLKYCLLVQSYFAKCSWSFPKGKVNENEDPIHCATREVFEETGYDITDLIVPNVYIEAVINFQYTRLYVVRNVSLKTQFTPRTRNEIKCCDWFPIDSLPTSKNDAISKAKLGINANSFFMIMPFVNRLKKWVQDIRETGSDSRRISSGSSENNSPISNVPTSLMTTAAAAAAAAVAGNTNNYIYNQKHLIINNSNKKIKQQTNNDDKHNALNNGGVLIVANNNNNNNKAGTATSNNSNPSKRQRHKSMGDLDGIKLNNLSSNTINQSSCKKATSMTAANNLTTTTTTTIATVSTASDIINVGNGNAVCGNCVSGKGRSANRRNSNSTKLSSSGSSIGGNSTTNNGNSVAGSSSAKRQLFHSHSQNGGSQYGEKIVSSFDLIRKEKQQLKAAAQAKNNKQQQQLNDGSNRRVRAKSQGDKMSMQQQSTHKNNSSINVNNKQRVQKQQSMIVCNSNAIHNTNFSSDNVVACKTSATKSRSPPPICGSELLALAAESVLSINSPPKATVSAPNTAQKQRPASVSLHFATPPAPAKDPAVQQIRILKRSTSYQPQPAAVQNLEVSQQEQTQANEQESEQKRQQPPQKFTPSFNSWTNFSFTKNFIANVFC